MFADPFSNLMLVILLFFAGLLIMFLFFSRNAENARRDGDEHKRQMMVNFNTAYSMLDDILSRIRKIEKSLDLSDKESVEEFADQQKGRTFETINDELERLSHNSAEISKMFTSVEPEASSVKSDSIKDTSKDQPAGAIKLDERDGVAGESFFNRNEMIKSDKRANIAIASSLIANPEKRATADISSEENGNKLENLANDLSELIPNKHK